MLRREKLLRDVGRRVAELRVGAGMTQEALAAALNVTPRYLQRIEHGGENLTLLTLDQLARHLGVDLPALFEAPSATPPPRVRVPAARSKTVAGLRRDSKR